MKSIKTSVGPTHVKEASSQGSKNDAKFSSEKKAFIDICTSDKGEIFVTTKRKKGNYKTIYDVFDAEGKYITRTALDVIPRVIKNNKLHGIFFDEDGSWLVKRYNLSWRY